MKKRLLTAVLAAAAIGVLPACSSGDDNEDAPASSEVTETASVEESEPAAESSPEVSEEAAPAVEEQAPAPQEEQVPAPQEEQAPAPQEPAPEPEAPELPSGGGGRPGY